jgi:hypothetical protein
MMKILILDCYEYGQISSENDSFISNSSKYENIICNRTKRVSYFNTKTVSNYAIFSYLPIIIILSIIV